MESPIDDAAADFGRHSRGGGGWALGLEVAACVELGDAGRPARNRSDRTDFKVSASEFARRSGTTHQRVVRYLEGWERAAKKRIVRPASKLTPGDWNNQTLLPIEWKWSEFYEVPANDKGTRATAENIDRQMFESPDLAEAAAAALVRDHPELIAQHIVENPEAHRIVIRESSARSRAQSLEPKASEPFARLTSRLYLEALAGDARHMHEIVVREFSGVYAWRPGELEHILKRIGDVEQMLADVRLVLTNKVSDEALADLLKGS